MEHTITPEQLEAQATQILLQAGFDEHGILIPFDPIAKRHRTMQKQFEDSLLLVTPRKIDRGRNRPLPGKEKS